MTAPQSPPAAPEKIRWKRTVGRETRSHCGRFVIRRYGWDMTFWGYRVVEGGPDRSLLIAPTLRGAKLGLQGHAERPDAE